MSTLTPAETDRIRDFLRGINLTVGVGLHPREEHYAGNCSIAAINLALTGTLTDVIPMCMSSVIGYWIMQVQDFMPDHLRNSTMWRELLPLAAGTGHDPVAEDKRAALIRDWRLSNDWLFRGSARPDTDDVWSDADPCGSLKELLSL